MMVSLLTHICVTRPQCVNTQSMTVSYKISWTKLDWYKKNKKNNSNNSYRNLVYIIINSLRLSASVNYTIIGSDNGLLPGWHQAIIWTNAGVLLTGLLGTNLSEILIEIYTFSFKKMHLKMLLGKWQPFCLGLNVLAWLSSLCILMLSDIHTIGCWNIFEMILGKKVW